MKGKKVYLYVNALSSLGSRMDLIATSALIFTFSNSVYWLSAFFVARQLGGMLFSMVAGVLADRVDRRRAMLISDAGAGLAILSVLLFPYPTVVVGAAFVKGMLYSLFHISFQASLPQMFGRHALVSINALTIRLESVVGIVGFALGGLLTDYVGYGLVIAFDAATFFVSAWFLLRIRWVNHDQQMDNGALLADEQAPVRTRLGATCAYLAKHPVLFVVSFLAFFEALSTASHNYGLPLLAEQLLPQDAFLHGTMWSLMSVGAWAGTYMVSLIRLRLMTGLLMTSLLSAIAVTVAFYASQLWSVLLLLSVAGIFTGAAQVCKNTLMQQADSRIRGRVMGIQNTLSRSGFFVGFLTAPSVAVSLELSGMVFLAQMIFASCLMLLLIYLHNRKKKA